MLTRLGFAEQDEPNVLRRPLSGVKQLTWTSSVPLVALKSAGKRAGATVNDVALTAIAGALRDYLTRHGQQVSRLTAVDTALVPDSEALLTAHSEELTAVIADLDSLPA